MRISFGELEVKFQMLILQWCNDCQNEAGDKPFSKHKTKKTQFSGKSFFLLFKSVFQLEVQVLFKWKNTSGKFYFKRKKNIGCYSHVACFIYLKKILKIGFCASSLK